MIIVQLAGGLGNQMFQYALYLQLKNLGKEVRIDDVAGFAGDNKRTPALAVFGIEYDRPTKRELEQMLDSSMLPWQRVRRKLFGRNRKSYFEENKLYHPEVLTWDDIYLEGYWQTEKYFASIADQVKNVYDMDVLWQYVRRRERRAPGSVPQDEYGNGGKKKSLDDWLSYISSVESVGIHVRRGDYLMPEHRDLYGGICTEAYYREAMRVVKDEHPGCVFFLFTNDKEWAYTLADAEDGQNAVEIVDPAEEDDYAELVLMSRCKHNILANSSFGWWASYLNRNDDKIVIAPDRWLNGWDCRDIYREDMRRISV